MNQSVVWRFGAIPSRDRVANPEDWAELRNSGSPQVRGKCLRKMLATEVMSGGSPEVCCTRCVEYGVFQLGDLAREKLVSSSSRLGWRRDATLSTHPETTGEHR